MRHAFLTILIAAAGFATSGSPTQAAPSLHSGIADTARTEIISRRTGDGIAAEVRQQGFVRVEAVERSRHAIELRALRPTGEVLRMRFDPRTGQLLSSQRIGWQGHAGLVPAGSLSNKRAEPRSRFGPLR